jgi:hypothetical protein
MMAKIASMSVSLLVINEVIFTLKKCKGTVSESQSTHGPSPVKIARGEKLSRSRNQARYSLCEVFPNSDLVVENY